MATDVKEILRRVLDELDTQERNDLLLELQNKRLTGKEIADAIREMPPAERAAVREAFIEVAEDEGGREEKKQAKELEKEAEHEEEAKGVEKPIEEEKKRKTRAGRKHGRAYNYTVKNGKVILTDVATIYSGEDEPDEVELYDENDEENEEENEEEEEE